MTQLDLAEDWSMLALHSLRSRLYWPAAPLEDPGGRALLPMGFL